MKFYSIILCFCFSLFGAEKSIWDYYSIEYYPMPEGQILEIGGIAELPGGRLAVSTRHGEVWIAEHAYDKTLSQVKWKRFAQGLHEGFGLFERGGDLWVTQKTELTRLIDKDGDNRADQYKTISADWGVTNDFHEFAFGSDPDKNGDVWVTLCLSGSTRSAADYRGWTVKISPEGKMTPVCSGIRSPGGIGFNHSGDAFYCDNQGTWNGSSSLKHLKPGGFMGNPEGNSTYAKAVSMGPEPLRPNEGSRIETERKRIPALVPPAVIFPHTRVGQSPTGVTWDHSEGNFGPFQNQTLVGEISHAEIQRVVLEKVNGVYQGAVVKFLSGIDFGVVPVKMSKQSDYLFVGGTNRGWGSKGNQPFGLARVSWKGITPFEVLALKVTATGFEVEFTEAIDVASLEQSMKKAEAFTYIYQSKYGSPEVDQKSVEVIEVLALGEDQKKFHLIMPNRVKGHVHHFDFKQVKSLKGLSLLNPDIYYTLNEIPSR